MNCLFTRGRSAWNAGRQIGAKRALKARQIWAIRFFLDREGRMRDRALFDLAIDSKLRGCDLVKLKIGTLVTGHDIRARAMVIQQKTGRPVQFEITSDARTNAGMARKARELGRGFRLSQPSRSKRPTEHQAICSTGG
jgi:hypothetical protein